MALPVGTEKRLIYDYSANMCLEEPVVSDASVQSGQDPAPTDSASMPPDYKQDASKLKSLEKSREQNVCAPDVLVSNPAEWLPKLHQIMADRLRWMDKQARDFDNDTNTVVRTTSDWVSEAGDHREKFQKGLQQAALDLSNAEQATQHGDWNVAYSSLQNADTQLSRTEESWRNYTDATTDGAESMVHGLRVVRNISAAFVAVGATTLIFGVGAGMAGGLATSAGGHVGLLSVALGGEHESSPTNNTPSKVDVKKSEEPQPGLCQPAGPKNRKSADYNGESCQPVADPAKEQLEKRIAAAIREKRIDPHTIKRDPKELIAEANRALTEWKQDPSATSDYGNFFLQTEAPDVTDQTQLAHEAELQEQWKRNGSSYKTAVKGAPEGEGIKAVMSGLFDDYLTLYVRGNANMSDIIDGGGGNCEAQTKLIMAGTTAGGVKLPPNQRFAVQLFEDHMQAVVYDKKRGAVHNLLTGEETTEIRAPLYDPHIFQHTYLESRGEASPVNTKDLLIVDVPEHALAGGAHSSFSTNSKLHFPGGKGFYNSGPIPEVAYVHPPSGIRDSVSSGGGNENIDIFDYDDKAMAKDDVPEDRKDYVKQFDQDSYGVGFKSIYRQNGANQLVFSNREQADYYNSLPDAEAKRKFLITLTNQTVSASLNSPDVRRGASLLANPASLKSQNSRTVGRAIKTMGNVKNIIDHAAYVIANQCPLPGTVGTENGRYLGQEIGFFAIPLVAARGAVRSDIYDRGPSLRVLETRRDGLRQRIEKNPLEFVLFMDRLPAEQRGSFMNLVEYVDVSGQEAENQSHATEKIRKTIDNRHIIGVGEKPGYKSQIIEVTLVGDGQMPKMEPFKPKPKKGDVGLENREGQKGREKKKAEMLDDSAAPYRVSPESMIDFTLEYTPGRWSPDLAKEFRRVNRDGQYDRRFLNHYHSLNQTYPASQRRFEDPYEKAQEENMDHGMMHGKNDKVAYDIQLILQDIVRRHQTNSFR